MPTNGFYNVNEVYTEKYYQLPQWLFTNEKYKDLSNNARIAYALLKDRNRYSIKNHWFDADGNIYFILAAAVNAIKAYNLFDAKEQIAALKAEFNNARSYDDALDIIRNYVDIIER